MTFDTNYYNRKRNLEQKPTKEEYQDFKRRVVYIGICSMLVTILFISVTLPNLDIIVKTLFWR
jgi:hypothetical protein